jgi:hypothetical protein
MIGFNDKTFLPDGYEQVAYWPGYCSKKLCSGVVMRNDRVSGLSLECFELLQDESLMEG